jgi:hypothetical protein
MRRRGRAGSQLAKGRGSASGPKARKATTPRVPAAAMQEQVDALTRELKDAREQQTATSEMLQVISGSRSELKPIFEGILKNATRLCEATFGHLWHNLLGFGEAFEWDSRVVARKSITGLARR